MDRRKELMNSRNALEEHWIRSPNAVGLNPKKSNFLFKEHVVRLHEIYSRRKQTMGGIEKPMTPLAELYGINGLMRKSPSITKKVDDKREEIWDDIVLRTRSRHNDLNRRPSSAPSSRRGPSAFLRETEKALASSASNAQIARSRRDIIKNRRSLGLCVEDLTILGVYSFNENQRQVYRAFVDMLKFFDNFDRKNILEDIEYECESELDLQSYGGTRLQSRR